MNPYITLFSTLDHLGCMLFILGLSSSKDNVRSGNKNFRFRARMIHIFDLDVPKSNPIQRIDFVIVVIPLTKDSSNVFVLTMDSLASSSSPLLLKMLLLLFLIQLLRKELLTLIWWGYLNNVHCLPLNSNYVICFH